MKLSLFQEQLTQALLTGENTLSLESVLKRYPKDELQARLRIYRNNIFYSLTEALRDTYNTINVLVGDEFFGNLANAYIKEYPPHQAQLITLGKSFPAFIAQFKPTQSLPYLADCARLDWQRHCAFHAAEATPVASQSFASISHDNLIHSHFSLHPSLDILSSPYAIFTIWDEVTNSQTTDASIHYDNAENILTLRPHTDVQSYCISAPVTTLFDALRSQHTLIDAVEKALINEQDTSNPTFNPTEAIAFLIRSGAIIAIHEPHIATP